MSSCDLYETLGLNKKATKKQIKKAYRKKAKKMHPDVGGDESEFSDLNRAYTILIDDNLREIYDKTGTVNTSQGEERVRSSAIEQLVSMFNKIITDNNDERIVYYDLVHFMKSNCKRIINEAEAVAVKKEKEKKVPKMVMKRLEYKGSDENVLFSAVEYRLKKINAEIEEAKFRKKVAVEMIKILTNYSFHKKYREPIFTDTTTTKSGGGIKFYWR